MSVTTTALPFGADGYECFATKGACRKCGNIAYFKRRCERCYRKFCHTCAPQSIQRYGEREGDECCIGCEPYLVVTPAESEPIFELEPESGEILLNHRTPPPPSNNNSSMTTTSTGCTARPRGPIHVPLSAVTCATSIGGSEDDEQCCTTNDCYPDWQHQEPPQSPPVSASTLSTDTESNDSEEEEDEEDEASAADTTMSIKSEGFIQSPVDFLGALPSWQEIQDRLYGYDNEPPKQKHRRRRHKDPVAVRSQSPKRKQQQQQHGAYRTAESPRRIRKISEDLLGPPPRTPDAGCCTACQVYSTGKTPCPTCGTKYCRESRCQQYLYDDGTCAKCRTKPRMAKIPHSGSLPVSTGCCTACQQYAMGKIPCETCGAKYCQEAACQTYLFSNGTCVVCHGNI